MNIRTFFYHLSVLNDIFSELEIIRVKIDDDEDKALRLIWYIPSSYEHLKHVLIYGRKILSFEEVASKIIRIILHQLNLGY